MKNLLRKVKKLNFLLHFQICKPQKALHILPKPCSCCPISCCDLKKPHKAYLKPHKASFKPPNSSQIHVKSAIDSQSIGTVPVPTKASQNFPKISKAFHSLLKPKKQFFGSKIISCRIWSWIWIWIKKNNFGSTTLL